MYWNWQSSWGMLARLPKSVASRVTRSIDIDGLSRKAA
ncbi:UNVERIFIED_CONTAM: hypothetical protein GTU68_021199 [Idotea baltica]|nr:hypothetical protein [Idotea baltica]